MRGDGFRQSAQAEVRYVALFPFICRDQFWFRLADGYLTLSPPFFACFNLRLYLSFAAVRYLLFHQKMQTSKVYIREASRVGALPLCLFGTRLRFLETEKPPKQKPRDKHKPRRNRDEWLYEYGAHNHDSEPSDGLSESSDSDQYGTSDRWQGRPRGTCGGKSADKLREAGERAATVKVELDGWVKFRLPLQTAHLVPRLRAAIRRILLHKLASGQGAAANKRGGKKRDSDAAQKDGRGAEEASDATAGEVTGSDDDKKAEAIIDAVAVLLAGDGV